MAALIALAVLIVFLCGAELVIPHLPRLDAWLEHFLSRDVECEEYDASEFNSHHPR